MRKLQNIISIFGNVLVRQGYQLVVRIESLRSLRASSSISALRYYAFELALVLRHGAWQGPSPAWSLLLISNTARVGTASCFASVGKESVVKQDQRRHQIMCHRTAD